MTKQEITWVDRLTMQLKQGKKVSVTFDQIFSPIHWEDAVQGIHQLCLLNCRGLYQLCGREPLSYFAIASKIVKELSLPSQLVEAVSLDAWNDGVMRPKKITMSPEKFLKETSFSLQSIEQQMESCLRSLHVS